MLKQAIRFELTLAALVSLVVSCTMGYAAIKYGLGDASAANVRQDLEIVALKKENKDLRNDFNKEIKDISSVLNRIDGRTEEMSRRLHGR